MDDPVAKYFEEYQKLLNILTADVVTAEEELKRSDTQDKRRIYVRAIFALFEGDTFQRKRLALLRHDHVQETFSEKELALLREEQYDLDKKVRHEA